MTEHLEPDFNRQRRELGKWYEDILDKAIERWTGKTPDQVRRLIARIEALINLAEWVATPALWLRKKLAKYK